MMIRCLTNFGDYRLGNVYEVHDGLGLIWIRRGIAEAAHHKMIEVAANKTVDGAVPVTRKRGRPKKAKAVQT